MALEFPFAPAFTDTSSTDCVPGIMPEDFNTTTGATGIAIMPPEFGATTFPLFTAEFQGCLPFTL